MIGTGDCATIVFSASASSSRGTATRITSAPASAQRWIWSIVAERFAVSVFVIVWTATGAPPPIRTPPTSICTFEAMWRVYERRGRGPRPVGSAPDGRAAERHGLRAPGGRRAARRARSATSRAAPATSARCARTSRPGAAGGCARGCSSTSATSPRRRPCWARRSPPPCSSRRRRSSGWPTRTASPAMARAAAGAGTIMTLSTLCTSTPAEVAAAAPGAPRWLQLYVTRDRGDLRARSSTRRSTRASARSSSPSTRRCPGRRERDHRTGFRVPGRSRHAGRHRGARAQRRRDGRGLLLRRRPDRDVGRPRRASWRAARCR